MQRLARRRCRRPSCAFRPPARPRRSFRRAAAAGQGQTSVLAAVEAILGRGTSNPSKYSYNGWVEPVAADRRAPSHPGQHSHIALLTA